MDTPTFKGSCGLAILITDAVSFYSADIVAFVEIVDTSEEVGFSYDFTQFRELISGKLLNTTVSWLGGDVG